MSRARILKGGRSRQTTHPPRLVTLLKAGEENLARLRRSRLDAIEVEAQERLVAIAQEGLIEKEALLDEARAEAVGIIIEGQRAAQTILERAQQDLTRLAVGIAEKILGAELHLAPERVTEIVAQVLRAAGASERLVARVHPLDLPLLEVRWEALSRLAEQGTLELQADVSIGRGGCILETDRGVADGRLEVQLATIQAALATDSSAAASDENARDTLVHESATPSSTLEGGLTTINTTTAAPLVGKAPPSTPSSPPKKEEERSR